MEDYSKYSNQYSELGFIEKLKNVAKKAGMELLFNAALLYRMLHNPNISAPTKALIVGVLGYLILPIDAIPDIIPVSGLSDDLAAILSVVKIVSSFKTPQIESEARELLKSVGING